MIRQSSGDDQTKTSKETRKAEWKGTECDGVPSSCAVCPPKYTNGKSEHTGDCISCNSTPAAMAAVAGSGNGPLLPLVSFSRGRLVSVSRGAPGQPQPPPSQPSPDCQQSQSFSHQSLFSMLEVVNNIGWVGQSHATRHVWSTQTLMDRNGYSSRISQSC